MDIRSVFISVAVILSVVACQVASAQDSASAAREAVEVSEPPAAEEGVSGAEPADNTREATPAESASAELASQEELASAEPASQEEPPPAEQAMRSKEYNDKGLKLLQEQKREEAIESFKKSIELDPRNAQAYKNLGLVYSWQGKHEDAITVFKDLITARPDYIPGYRNLILVYNMDGAYDKAIPYAEKAIKLSPGDMAVMGYLVYDYVNTGEYEKSVIYSQKLIAKNPDRPKAYRYLAMGYDGLGRIDDAREAFKKYYNMAGNITKNKDAPEKIHDMEFLFKKMRAEVLYAKGDKYLRSGEIEKGLAHSLESIKLNPDDYRPYYNVAKVYEFWKKYPEAVESLKKAVNLNPALLDAIIKSSEFVSLKATREFKEAFGGGE